MKVDHFNSKAKKVDIDVGLSYNLMQKLTVALILNHKIQKPKTVII